MPRFHVVAFDSNDNSTCSRVSKQSDAARAICHLPWFEEIYRGDWIMEHIYAEDDEASTISNCWQRLGWVVICVNLDEEIMKDLNGGDSSSLCSNQVSSPGN